MAKTANLIPFLDNRQMAPYGIREGQVWRSVRYSSHFGDFKVLGVQKRSKELLVMGMDLSDGKTRTMNAYNLARTGNYVLKGGPDDYHNSDRWYDAA
jgi:hypothetical protein